MPRKIRSGCILQWTLYLVVLSSAVAASSGCARSDVSGTYMASDQHATIMLQIVETPDRHLSGQVTGVFVQPDGKIQNVNEAISGAVDGVSLTIETKPNGTLTIGPELSGAMNWKHEIELTGPARNGQVATFVFVRGTAEQFQTMAAQVRSRSDVIVKTRAMQQNAEQFLSGVKRLTVSMQRFGPDADKTLHGAPNVEQRYRSITSKMRANLDRERSLVANSNASQTRVDIAVGMLQGPLASDQIHFQVQSAQSIFQNSIEPTAKQASVAMAACATVVSGKYRGPMESEIASACRTLANEYPGFQQRYKATAGTLARLETVYQQERKAQQLFSNEAQKIE